MRLRYLISGALLTLLTGCGGDGDSGTAEPVIIREASGVLVHDGQLLIVDDSVNGAYFKVPLDSRQPGTVIELNEALPVRIQLPKVGIWVDLEGIEMLTDGRLALLSERLRSIVGE
ncbi:MAG: hypothetical protein GY953_41960, partial [bacterium]|nr:hypothetical protein [bacterium]